jgi:hypothetical protein
MKRAITTVVLFGLSGLLCTSITHAQAPTVSKQPVVDFPAPPPSLRQFAAAVHLVVLAQVTQAGSPVLETSSKGREFVRRHHQVEILEVLKGPPVVKAGHRVFVRQEGGTVDLGGREISTQYLQRLLEPGQTVLLFLDPVPNAPANRYYIAYGPAGGIWISDGAGEIPTALRSMPEISSRDRVALQELLVVLRSSR